ncbi:MAG: hypothetical protein E7393_04020 [Ruminococcaceae bacterium]|nr:hypothetical protein [Oscillospiraceae bacterium]
MLTIQKIDDTQVITAYINKNKLPDMAGHHQYMALYDGDALCGLGALSLVGTKVYMNLVHTSSGNAFNHSLAKALLNMADLRGIKTIYGSNLALSELYTALRFTKEKEEYVLRLEGYFTVACD